MSCWNGSGTFLYRGQASWLVPRDVKRVRAEPFIQLMKVIKIPGIRVILESAFCDCEELSKLELCEGFVQIERYAFKNCKSLEYVRIPSTIKTIDYSAFCNCERLMKVDLGGGLLEMIGDSAFTSCTSLTQIRIPSSVRYIGSSAFCDCYQLEAVELCEGLEQIRDCAFLGCSALKNIRIPSTVKEIYIHAFRFCKSLEQVFLCEGQLNQIREGAFDECISLKHIRVPSTVKEIDRFVFRSCRKLESVELSEGLLEINANAFSSCKSLTCIKVPSTVRTIGRRAFVNCQQLISVELGDKIEEIGSGAFRHCFSLRNITIAPVKQPPPSLLEGCCHLQQSVCNYKGRRFDKLPLHKLCYYHTYSPTEVILKQLKSITSDTQEHSSASVEELSGSNQVCTNGVASIQDASNMDNAVDSTLVWGALAAFLGTPAPKFVLQDNKKLKRRKPVNLWQCDTTEDLDEIISLPDLDEANSLPDDGSSVQDSQVVSLEDCGSGCNLSNECIPSLQESDTISLQDSIGMSPLHILACSTQQKLELYQCIVKKYPTSLITKDKSGFLPIAYAMWVRAPPEIVNFLIDTQKSSFPNYDMNWNEMIETLCRSGAPLDVIQVLFQTQLEFFPKDIISWQNVAHLLTIYCLVRSTSSVNFFVIWDEMMEILRASQTHNKLVQYLQGREQAYFPDRNDKQKVEQMFEKMFQPPKNWWQPGQQSSLRTLQFLMRFNVSKRVDSIGVRKWRLVIDEMMKGVSSLSSADVTFQFDSMNSKLVCYEDKYHQLTEAAFLLELALWKSKINEFTTMQCLDNSHDIGVKDLEIDLKLQCRINCGADIIVPNVLMFLVDK